MKASIIFITAFLFLFGCKEKRQGVEIVPNLDEIYLPVDDVDTPPKESEAMNKKMDKGLVDAAKSLYDKNSGKPMRFKIALRFYLNEKGTVDKIKDISNHFNKMGNSTDSIADYPNNQKLAEAVAKSMADWKFGPAKNHGQNVKCRSDFRLNILLRPDGSYSKELPDLAGLGNNLKNLFNPNDRYFIMVEQMPEPIGGMQAIQSKIHYPEIAKRAGIEGKVYIKAFINENGDVVRTEVVKGIGGGCDRAAEIAVQNTMFKPGMQRGKRVKVQVMVPIVFKLK